MGKWKPTSLPSKEVALLPYASTVIMVKGPIHSGWELYDLLVSQYGVEFPKVLRADATWAGCCFHVGPTILLWVGDVQAEDLLNTVAHECFHVVRKVMKHADVRKLNRHNEEAWAYLQGWLTEIVYDFMVEPVGQDD